jgi:N-acetylated-alpha-linked acidic dipeptidase
MAGHTSMRMLNADILPFDFRSLYKQIKTYTAELQALALNLRETINIQNENKKKKYWIITVDTSRPLIPAVVKLNAIPIAAAENAIVDLGKATDHAYDQLKTAE